MKRRWFIILIFSIVLLLTSVPISCNERDMSTSHPESRKGSVGITDVLVDGKNCRSAHITTRPHNRKVLYHEPSRIWFIFYGTGHWIENLGEAGLKKEKIMWRASNDGQTFSSPISAVVGNGHSSSTDVLLVGDLIYLIQSRFGYWRSKEDIPALLNGNPIWHPSRIDREKPNYYSPYEVFPFCIADKRLVAGKAVVALPGDAHIGHIGPHYGSITRDTNGYLWIAARVLIKANGNLATWVSRSTRPDDISTWRPHTVLFESAGPGTHAPQILALDKGYVACVIFTKYEQITAVYIYNPDQQSWSDRQIIGRGYKSKRACAVFDSNSERLHVVYTDEEGDARHRVLSKPYADVNWSPPLSEFGVLVARKAGVTKGDDDLTLSIDLSKKPAPLALVHRGPDHRLHLRYYDGKNWLSKDVKIGLQDRAMSCDEASAVVDFTHGLGVLYWCQWKDPKVRKLKDSIGQLRFTLVKDVAALFFNNKSYEIEKSP
ncbi:MAG: hypothetical protein SWO11_03945 [Thermodesulfobacteriota bacterium]|nr:hypothetical protein [Thermodesulfobacteriota bacterium]